MTPHFGNFIGWILRWVYGHNYTQLWKGVPVSSVRRIIPSWAIGQTWGTRILIRSDFARASSVSEYLSILNHEYVHVLQWRRLGFWGLGFIVAYLWESMRHGYTNNRFEVEARKLSGESQ